MVPAKNTGELDVKNTLKILEEQSQNVTKETHEKHETVTKLNFHEVVENKNELLKANSEEAYIKIVKDIVNISDDNLKGLRENKKKLRGDFVEFFRIVLMIQLCTLLVLLAVKGGCPEFNLSDNVLITFMSSIFVETLGCLIIMITFAFQEKSEVEIVSILNTVIETFQKYKNE